MKSLTRRQEHERKNKAARKKLGALKANKPLRDPKYLAFIRSLACAACIPSWYRELGGEFRDVFKIERYSCVEWGHRKSQACHMGPHALGRKASDYTAIPMCQSHHEQYGSHAPYGIDLPKLQAKLKEAFEKENDA